VNEQKQKEEEQFSTFNIQTKYKGRYVSHPMCFTLALFFFSSKNILCPD